VSTEHKSAHGIVVGIAGSMLMIVGALFILGGLCTFGSEFADFDRIAAAASLSGGNYLVFVISYALGKFLVSSPFLLIGFPLFFTGKWLYQK
jgi:hypothetical protein